MKVIQTVFSLPAVSSNEVVSIILVAIQVCRYSLLVFKFRDDFIFLAAALRLAKTNGLTFSYVDRARHAIYYRSTVQKDVSANLANPTIVRKSNEFSNDPASQQQHLSMLANLCHYLPISSSRGQSASSKPTVLVSVPTPGG